MTPPPISLRQLRRPSVFIACGFGVGLAPFAPGTFGALAALPLYWFLCKLHPALYAGIVVGMAALGVVVCARAAVHLGARDHPAMVWDEIVGMLIAMFALPFAWHSLLAGFVLFRFFDIVKPWPINRIDAGVAGGIGVMLDDIVAGVFAYLALRGLLALGAFAV